jgi:hypothetical protein
MPLVERLLKFICNGKVIQKPRFHCTHYMSQITVARLQLNKREKKSILTYVIQYCANRKIVFLQLDN